MGSVLQNIERIVSAANAELPDGVSPLVNSSVTSQRLGRRGPGNIVFNILKSKCLVVTDLEVLDYDRSNAAPIAPMFSATGPAAQQQLLIPPQPIPFSVGEVFYVFGHGLTTLMFTFTPAAGFDGYVSLNALLVPSTALKTLKRMSMVITPSP